MRKEVTPSGDSDEEISDDIQKSFILTNSTNEEDVLAQIDMYVKRAESTKHFLSQKDLKLT